MTISYPLAWPTELNGARLRIAQRNAVGRNESPFDFSEQVYDWGGQAWSFEVVMPRMDRDMAAIYNAFLFRLKGMKGTFLMPVFGSENPRGIATGTPLVKGAGQTGPTLITDGWTASQTNILKEWSFFNLGSGASTRLYVNLTNANSNGSGEATLDQWPDLRSSPADNAPLTITNPKALLRLAQNMNPIDLDSDNFSSFSFPCNEALDGT